MEQKSPDIIYAQIVAGTLCASREPNEAFGEQFPQYIREDLVDEMLKTAEDHAFFAGQEKLREKMLEWAKTERAKCSDETHPYAQFMNVVIDKLKSL